MLSLFVLPLLLNIPSSFAPLARAALVPAGSDIYVFAGNEDGVRQPLKSNGNGTFTAAASFLYGDNNRGGAIADYDEDGDLDFVGCNDDISACHLFLQTAPGTFTQSTNVAGGGFGLAGTESGMAADDFDQDGHADVLLGGNQNVAAIFFGNGTGNFPSSITNLLPAATTAPYFAKDTGDLDGNGYPDVILGAAGGGNVYSYLNTAGTFSGPFTLFDATPTPAPPNTVTVADFDGDGFLDIVAGGEIGGEISLWKGNGTGNSSSSFTLVGQIYDFNTQASADSYDFDGDQDQDLMVVARASGSIFFFAGNGDGTFLAPVLVASIAPSAFGLAAPPAPPIRSIVHGTVFNDTNSNGTNDDGAGGFANAKVTLSGTDHLGAAVSRSVSTPGNGEHEFDEVRIDDGNGYSLAITVSPAASPGEFFVATTMTSATLLSVPRENSDVTKNFGYHRCPDLDQDGFSPEGGICGLVDCNDSVAAINPNAAEICDGIDNNCDGVVDEGGGGLDADGDGFTAGTGLCGGGDCNDGDASIHPGASETCNNVDDDCDGASDENLTQQCGTTDVGECSLGSETCMAGSWGSCVGEVSSASEVCDSKDNDCDGSTDEGFDQDGDGFMTCTGDCNDIGASVGEASIFLTLSNVSSSGPGADMTANIFVGNGTTPAGFTTLIIPLTQNGTAIVDPSSSPDLPGFHVQRGIEGSKPFVRLTAYGHNSPSTREHVEGTFVLTNATVKSSHGGPMGSYERPHDGACTGQPNNDEFTALAGSTSGNFCSTTNTKSDTLTIFYALPATLHCLEVTNPSVQCGNPLYALCGACIHPGVEDPYGDGIDNDCDGSPECSMKTDYDEKSCSGKITAKNDAELDAYLLDYGLKNGKYRDLEIAYSLNRPMIDIHSPCKISIAPKKIITGDLICIDGREGVRAKSQGGITGNKIALLSQHGSVWVKTKTTIAASSQLLLQGFKKTVLGSHSTVTGNGIVRIFGVGPKSIVALDSHVIIDALKLVMTAVERARLGPKTTVSVDTNFHMDADHCTLHQSSAITAGSTSGRCLTPPTFSSDDSDETDEEEDE